jgi:hypothetical protein
VAGCRLERVRAGRGRGAAGGMDLLTRLQIAFALGACGGLARILMPSAWNTPK